MSRYSENKSVSQKLFLKLSFELQSTSQLVFWIHFNFIAEIYCPLFYNSCVALQLNTYFKVSLYSDVMQPCMAQRSEHLPCADVIDQSTLLYTVSQTDEFGYMNIVFLIVINDQHRAMVEAPVAWAAPPVLYASAFTRILKFSNLVYLNVLSADPCTPPNKMFCWNNFRPNCVIAYVYMQGNGTISEVVLTGRRLTQLSDTFGCTCVNFHDLMLGQNLYYVKLLCSRLNKNYFKTNY